MHSCNLLLKIASPLSPLSTKYESRSISTKLTEAAFIHPHDSKGKASCVPPERLLSNNNEPELITPQSRDSSTIIYLYQEKDEFGVKGEGCSDQGTGEFPGTVYINHKAVDWPPF